MPVHVGYNDSKKDTTEIMTVLRSPRRMGLNPSQLVSLISERSWGVPVRDMEALIGWGNEAGDVLLSFLQSVDPSRGEPEGLLWLLVALGQMRVSKAVQIFQRVLAQSDDLEILCASIDGLAKLGREAINPLASMMSRRGEERRRIFSIAGLGRANDPRAWLALEGAVTDDPELDFAAARALAERGTTRDERLIHEAYVKAGGWKKATLEMILVGMMNRRLPWALPYTDWRIRYRRLPRAGMKIPMDWPMVFSMLWESREELRPSREPDTLSLEEIRESARRMSPELRCEDCGETLRSPTGVPLCKEVEEDLISYQIDKIRSWRGDQWEDIHEVLDELDYQELDAIHLPEENDEQRRLKGEAMDAIDVVRKTLYWMVEQGLDTLSQGEGRLLQALEEARSWRAG